MNFGSALRSRATPVALIAALPPLFFAGNFIIARLLRDEVPPFQMSFWRWLLALLIVLPFSWPGFLKEVRTFRDEWLWLAVLGGIGVTAFNCLVYVALQTTEVINAALINGFFPAITFLLAAVILRQTVARLQWLGLAISFGGVVAIIARGQPGNLIALTINSGDALVLIAVTCWSIYTVLIRRRPSKLSPGSFLLATIAFGVMWHLPLVAWEILTKGGFTLTANNAAAILYLALFPSVLAYVLWNFAVQKLGAPRTGMFMHLMPVFSALLAILFLDERIFLYHAIGFACVLCGIILATRPPRTLSQ